MAVSSGKLKGMITTVIMLVVLFSVAATVLPLLTGSYYDLSTGYNSTQIGTAASGFATNSVNYVGLMLVLFLIIKLYQDNLVYSVRSFPFNNRSRSCYLENEKEISL